MRATALLSGFMLCALTTAVRAGETEPQPATACANPHQIMIAARAATGSELT
eukprot:SAG22_NODE_13859_length_392_cov_1.474403_1_plen_51_part_10